MKLWKLSLSITAVLLLLSGCNSRTQNMQLQNTNARQALQIQQQQAQIDALKKSINAKKKTRSRTKKTAMPQAPKKNIKLKKVEDNNYSSSYMYPGAQKKKKAKKAVKVATATPVAAKVSSNAMGKTECIAMIGEDKFTKYTQMFGSEAASVKRCNMLNAMR